MSPMKLKLEIVRGPEGDCVSLNNYRIAGPKPWGSGQVIKTFNLTTDDLISAVPELFYLQECKPSQGCGSEQEHSVIMDMIKDM